MKHANIYTVIFSLLVCVNLIFGMPERVLGQQDLPQGLDMRISYAEQGEDIWAVVQLEIGEQYYAYAPQDAVGHAVNEGQAVQLFVRAASLGEGRQGGILPVYFPRGVELEDYYVKGKMISAYTGSVSVFVPLGKKGVLGSDAQWQGLLWLLLCSKQHCLPVRLPVELSVPQGKALPLLMDQGYAHLWQQMTSQGPTAQNASAQEAFAYDDSGQGMTMSHQMETTSTKQGDTGASSRFSAELSRLKQKNLQDGTSLGGANLGGIVTIPLATKSLTTKTLTNKDSAQTSPPTPQNWEFDIVPYAPHLEVGSLGKALLLGLLAGLILNMMPCVLPVLTLKIQALLLSEEGEGRVAAFRTHNLFFAAGIVSQFLLLGVLLGSLGLMWGEFFQNILFVATMLVLVFVLALSLMGLFTLPMLDIKSAAHGSPRRQAFFSGMVATLLATPCSGPLLGGVLSWAFLQPLYLIVLTIACVGLGMALPYGLFAWQPQWVRFMPRPGAWMVLVEKMVAFFLLGTALYIFSFLPSYAHMPLLAGLLFLAVMGWLWGTFGGLQAPRWRRIALSVLFMGCAVGVVLWGTLPREVSHETSEQSTWQSFSPQIFHEKLGKVPLVVEFTADWCPNCTYVEKTVLTEENLRTWQKHYGVQYIKVDITRNNAEGEALLQALGSRSIPLTAIFASGEAAKRPVVLRDIYTKESLENALRQALP